MSYVNCQFNVASRLFLHISGDNRIHLWDIESKKEKISYVDKNHLSHKFNCFSWSQQSIDSHIGDANISTLSVGYSDGKILNWDLLRGVPSSSFDTIGNNIPSGIVYSLCKKYLFISSLSENLITKYSLSSGEVLATFRIGKKPVSKVAINPKVDVIAASR
jgi:WD40 repeat protein